MELIQAVQDMEEDIAMVTIMAMVTDTATDMEQKVAILPTIPKTTPIKNLFLTKFLIVKSRC